MRLADSVTPTAGVVVVLAVLLGGGFFPLPRMIVGGAFLVLWALAAAGSRGRLDRVEWSLIAIVAWAVVSAVWVHSSPLAAKEAITVWIIAGLLFGITRRGENRSRRHALFMLVIGAAFVAMAVIVDAVISGFRVGGLLENPNVAVALLAPTLPVGWEILDRLPRWRWAWSVLMVAGIVCTGSRAGLLAVVVVVGFLMPRGRVRLAGVLVGSLMAAGVLAWRFISQPDVLAWHRISIWQTVVKIWLSRPVTGIGPGGLAEAATAERILHPDEIGHYQFVIGYAESTPLAVLVQLGLVGFVLVCLTIALWWAASCRTGGPSKPLVASLVAMGALGLFHDFLIIDPVLWWWVVLVGCLGSAARVDEAKETPTDGRIVFRWSAALVMIWLTAWGMISPAYAKWSWLRSEPTTAQVIRVLRIEPWLSAAPAQRIDRLLSSRGPWSWVEAAEAVHWAGIACRTRPGLASGWADVGRVHLRILTDLNGTEHDVTTARDAFDKSCALDPHLPWFWLERARLARVVGSPELAIRFARRALAEEPNTVRGWQFLARLEAELGRLDRARAAVDEAEGRAVLAQRQNLSDYERELLRMDPLREIELSSDPE